MYRHNRKYPLAFIILRKLCAALVIGKGRKGNINGRNIARTLIAPRRRTTNARSIFTLITIAAPLTRGNEFNHRQCSRRDRGSLTFGWEKRSILAE